MKLKFLAGFYTSYLHKSHTKREVSKSSTIIIVMSHQ